MTYMAAHGVDPDEMQHVAASHQGLHPVPMVDSLDTFMTASTVESLLFQLPGTAGIFSNNP